MYCLTNTCYVCLGKKDNLVNIISSSVDEDIIHIISYLPFNLAWMRTRQTILICEECCVRLRDTYQFLAMCLNNSALMQGYMAKLNTACVPVADNEAELRVHLNNKHNDMSGTTCDTEVEDEEIYTLEWGPIINQTDAVFVKEEDAWKSEEIDEKEECLMDNKFTGSGDNEPNTEIFVHSSNTHDTDTDFDSSGFTSPQGHTINTKNGRSRIQSAGNQYKCTVCGKCFTRQSNVVRHMQIHTGEKPYKCARCDKCFRRQSYVVHHMRIHTGERPYQCSRCEKCFNQRAHLVTHMRTHTGERPYKCARCDKCFTAQSHLVRHMRIHTGEKPVE